MLTDFSDLLDHADCLWSAWSSAGLYSTHPSPNEAIWPNKDAPDKKLFSESQATLVIPEDYLKAMFSRIVISEPFQILKQT